MALAKHSDEKILEAMEELKRRRTELDKIQARPSYLTNMSFTYNEGEMNKAVNLQVVSDLKDLIMVAAFLKAREKDYIEAAKELAIENVPAFTWQRFSVADWLTDIKTRVNKIELTTKRKKVADLEERLGKLASPELRREIELDQLMREIGS